MQNRPHLACPLSPLLSPALLSRGSSCGLWPKEGTGCAPEAGVSAERRAGLRAPCECLCLGTCLPSEYQTERMLPKGAEQGLHTVLLC